MMFKSKQIVKVLLLTLILPLLVAFVLQTRSSLASNRAGHRIDIHFWHAMSGKNQIALKNIINAYNESQDKYRVLADYQGNYGDSLAKYLSVAGSSSSPDIVQVYDIGTQVMRDSKAYEPIQTMIDKTNYDKEQLEPRIADYYSLDHQLQSMPFNTSTSLMFYNKELLKKAGLTKVPETYEGILDLDNRLKASGSKAKAAGNLVYGWIFEQMLSNQAALNMNQENGHSGAPSQSLVNEQAGYNFLNWQSELLKAGAARNYGTDEATLVSSFIQGDFATMFESSAYSNQILTTAKFDVGIAAIPHPAEKAPAGVAIGGASLYLGKNRPSKNQEAAWDFMQFLASPKQQAAWSIATGYFPINKNAYQEKVLAENYAKFPELKNAVKQLTNAQAIPATAGFFSAANVYARKQLEVAESEVFNGAEVQKSLDKAAAAITKELILAKKTNER